MRHTLILFSAITLLGISCKKDNSGTGSTDASISAISCGSGSFSASASAG